MAAYASLEEFEFQAPKDFFQLFGLTRGILLLKSFIMPDLNLGVLLLEDLQMDLVLQLDAEGVDQQDEGLDTPLRQYAELRSLHQGFCSIALFCFSMGIRPSDVQALWKARPE